MQNTQAEGISQLSKLFSMQYAGPALQTGHFSHAEPAQLRQRIFQMQTGMGAVYFSHRDLTVGQRVSTAPRTRKA